MVRRTTTSMYVYPPFLPYASSPPLFFPAFFTSAQRFFAAFEADALRLMHGRSGFTLDFGNCSARPFQALKVELIGNLSGERRQLIKVDDVDRLEQIFGSSFIG